MPQLRAGLRSGALGALLWARLRGGALGSGLRAALWSDHRGALVSALRAGSRGGNGRGGGRCMFSPRLRAWCSGGERSFSCSKSQGEWRGRVYGRKVKVDKQLKKNF